MRRPRLLLVLFLAGAFSQAAQAWMGRAMLAAFQGNELDLGLFYAFWLLGIAAGSLAAGRAAQRLRSPAAAFSAAAGLLPAAAAFGTLLLALSRRLVEVPPSQPVSLGPTALWGLLATVPTGLVVGAVFSLACAALRGEEDAAAAYGWDALGGLAGGALSVLALSGGVPSWRFMGLLAGLLGASAAALPSGDAGRAGRGLGAAWALAALALLGPLGSRLQARADALRFRSLLPGLELAESFDTPYQSVDIARLGGQTSVVSDGKVAASFPESVEPAVEAALLLAERPGARRFLLVEGASRGLVAELLKHPVEAVDTLEPDARAFARVRPRLPAEWRRALDDPRVRVLAQDPRLFLNKAPEGAYDVIAALVPDPSTARLNRLFTREFYARCRAALAPGGVLAARAAASANYMGRELRLYDASIYRTLRDAFKDVRAAPGGETLFFASDGGGLSLDTAVLAKRYGSARPAGGLPREALLALWTPERAAALEKDLGGGEPNTDLRPVAYWFNTALWARLSGSGWLAALEKLRLAGARLFLIPVLVFALLRLGCAATEEDAGREERFTAGLAMAALGFAAMALQLVLLFSFQSRFGSLYAAVGLMNGLFMAGLALGAFASGRLGAGRAAAPALGLAAAAGAAACLAWLLPGLLSRASAGEGSYYGLALLVGAAAGAGFPSCVRLYGLRAGGADAAPGFAASMDHWGGMLGALLTGTCLVPLFGAGPSCRLTAAVLGSACAAAALTQLRSSGRLPALSLSGRAAPSFPWKAASWCAAGIALSVWLCAGKVRSAPGGPIGAPHVAPGTAGEGTAPAASPETLSVVSEARGFGGPMRLRTSFSKEGKILDVQLLESHETPSYAGDLGRWLRRLRGADAGRPLRLGRDIDGISGATVTSEAAAEALNRAGAAAREKFLGAPRPAPPPAPAPEPSSPGRGARLWAAALLLALFFPAYLSGRSWARLAGLAASLVLLGLASNTLISLSDVAALSRGVFPGAGRALWLLLAGFALLTSLLWGQAYCGFVCPFGAAQELFWHVGRALGLNAHASPQFDRAARYFKFLLLPAALCLYWITGREGWVSFEPMQHAFLFKYPAGMGLLLAVVLASALVFFRFWCRYFCPTGALLALFNKLALGRAWGPKRVFRCCDLGVRSEFDVDCIQCQRCVHLAARLAKGDEGS